METKTRYCTVCNSAFQVPVAKGRPHTKCELHRGAADNCAKDDRSTTTVTVDRPAPVKSTGDPLRDAVAEIARDEFRSQIDSLTEQIGKLSGGRDTLTVTRPDMSTVEIEGKVHKDFAFILDMLVHQPSGQMRAPLLVGPSGAGKTYLAAQLAKALGVPFYKVPIHSEMTDIDFFGYQDGHGVRHHRPHAEGWKNGGLILLTEVGSGPPGLNNALNTIIPADCKSAIFAGEEIDRSGKVYFMADDNTWLRGAENGYNGRQVQDVAFRDRFDFIEVGYDLELEESMVLATGLDPKVVTKWLAVVRQIRANAEGFDMVVTPRSVVSGATALKLGRTLDQVLNMNLLGGLSRNVREKLMAGVATF